MRFIWDISPYKPPDFSFFALFCPFSLSVVSLGSLVYTPSSTFHLLLFHGVLGESYVGFLFLLSPAGFLQRLFGDLWILLLFVLLLHAVQTISFASARSALPFTFTVGELAVVSQSLTDLILFLSAILFSGRPSLYSFPVADFISITIVATVLSFVTFVVVFPAFRKPRSFYCWLLLCSSVGLLTILPVRPIAWVFDCPLRQSLLLFCVTIAFLTLVLIVFSRSFQSRVSIVVFRKFFHLLVAFVFVPCLLLGQAPLIRLLSSCVLAAFVLVEVVKFFHILPFASWLEVRFEGLKDTKDVGKIMMSQIYLMLGFLLPLLFSSIEGTNHTEMRCKPGMPTLILPFLQAWYIGANDILSKIYN